MANDFSIDLETLGSKYNAPVLAIGIAAFNRDTGKVGPTHYVEIEIADAMRNGLLTASTLVWWMSQSDSARQVFTKPSKNKLPLKTALQSTGDFLRGVGKGVPTVWGNGSSFDITILEHAFDVAGEGLEPPWSFWNIRDMRTAVDMAGVKTKDYPRVGTHHNALDDAVFQAEVIADCFAKIAGRLAPSKKATPVVDDEDEL